VTVNIEGTSHAPSLTYFVPVPILQQFVFRRCPEVMTMPFISFHVVYLSFEGNLHDAFVMSKYAFVAISEVKAPYFDVLVRGDGSYELGISGYIE